MKNCFYFDLCVGVYVRTGVTTIHCRCIRQTGGAKVHLQDVLLVVNLLQVSMGAVGLVDNAFLNGCFDYNHR